MTRAFFAALAAVGLCLASAFVAGQAQAATRSSSVVPGDLRTQVLSLGAKCLPLEERKNVGCGGDAHVFQLLDRINPKPPHIKQLAAIYKQGAALCNKIKWVRNDPGLKTVNIFSTATFSELACYWGEVNSGKAAVALTMIIPNSHYKRSAGTCDNQPTAEWGSFKCAPVKGGVSAVMPYSQSMSKTAEQILDTTNGYLSIQRWEPNPAAYGSQGRSDAMIFNQIAGALSLP